MRPMPNGPLPVLEIHSLSKKSTVHPKHKVLAAGEIRDNHQGLRHLGDAVAGRIVGAAEADALTI